MICSLLNSAHKMYHIVNEILSKLTGKSNTTKQVQTIKSKTISTANLTWVFYLLGLTRTKLISLVTCSFDEKGFKLTERRLEE